MKRDQLGFISLSGLIATLGALLIASGMAWMVATNWHLFGAIEKVLLLGGSSSLALLVGGFADSKGRDGVSGAFYLLGSLLLTLSIFLVAQIYSTDASFQGFANLQLISWVSIGLISYIVRSKLSLIAALIQFHIWVSLQFLVAIGIEEMPPLGLIVELYLASGALLYGLSLLHTIFSHTFASTYRFWFVFYIMLFCYLLSFEWGLAFLSMALPGQKEKFSLIFIVIAALVYIAGAILALQRKPETKREVIGSVVVFAALLWLLHHSGGMAERVGMCQLKSCYQFPTQDECNAVVKQGMECKWKETYCYQPNCSELTEQVSCNSSQIPAPGCVWQESYCRQKGCYEFKSETDCTKLYGGVALCAWVKGACEGVNCSNYKDLKECAAAPKEMRCLWLEQQSVCAGRYGMYDSANLHGPDCAQYDGNSSICSAHKECKWRPYFGFNSIDPNYSPGYGILTTTWIIANIIAFAVVIGCSIYGVLYASTAIVNISALFFVLLVGSRYIGFLFSFWGYTSLSMIFISGGLLLLIGGWVIEKWRRKIVAKAKAQ